MSDKREGLPPAMAEIRKQDDVIKDLRHQLQQAEALVAELIVFGDTQGELSGDYNWELLKSSVNPQPLILRKQAEAVESNAKEWNPEEQTYSGRKPHKELVAEAQRLRQQADELEQNQ